jgi:HlyD family secretion protein
MILIFRSFTFWLGLAGLTGLTLFVRANTAALPMPDPLVAPADKAFDHGIAASGIVEALRENTSVGVPVAALVNEVAVGVSQQVAPGDVLLRLDDREVRARLTGLRAEQTYKEAEMRRAQRQYERLNRIESASAITREELEKREDDFLVAQAAVDKAKAGIAEQEALLERYTVRSPIAATILQVNIRAGEYAMPGSSTPAILLGNVNELQIRADVDEQIAPRVREGARAIAYLKGAAKDPLALEFLRIEPYIVPKKSLTGSSSERVDTRVLQVIFRCPNETSRKIYVGQQVDVFIEETE